MSLSVHVSNDNQLKFVPKLHFKIKKIKIKLVLHLSSRIKWILVHKRIFGYTNWFNLKVKLLYNLPLKFDFKIFVSVFPLWLIVIYTILVNVYMIENWSFALNSTPSFKLFRWVYENSFFPFYFLIGRFNISLISWPNI